MRPAQVVLVGLSGIVADIVRQIVSQHDDIAIAASVEGVDEVESVAEASEVDVVITAYPSRQPELRRFDRALVASPGLRVLAIQNDGQTASMYTLLPQTTQLGPLSPATLVEFIRKSAHSRVRSGP